MNQSEKAGRFSELHIKGKPVLLYNAWDAGSAKAILAAGAQAIATSSWSVAEAQGYRDGEAIPIGLAEQIVGRIAATVDVPVTVDFEGGYSEDDADLAANIARLLDLGVIGINFEDRVVKGAGLYDIARQAKRIATIRKAAEGKGVKLFINARTDAFFEHGDDAAAVVPDALERAKAYAAAGASGLFVPGLVDAALIGRIIEGTPLPVNVMVMDGVPSNDRLATLGVARISYGPIPYIRCREDARTGSQVRAGRRRSAVGGLSHEQRSALRDDWLRRDAVGPYRLRLRRFRPGRPLRPWRGLEQTLVATPVGGTVRHPPVHRGRLAGAWRHGDRAGPGRLSGCQRAHAEGGARCVEDRSGRPGRQTTAAAGSRRSSPRVIRTACAA